MRALRSFVVTVVAFVVLAAPVVVLADGRVALVVGNSTYAHVGRLPNPENDAADIARGPAPLFKVASAYAVSKARSRRPGGAWRRPRRQ